MKITDVITEAASPAQQAAIAISMKKAGKKPKQGVAEGAPELLKKEMPTHRHAEKLLAQNGVSKDDPDYHHHLGNTIKHLRQFGNIDLINKQGVAEATGDSKFDTMMGKISRPAMKQAEQQRKLSTIQSIADAVCNDLKCDYDDLTDQDLQFIADEASASMYDVMSVLGRQQFNIKRNIGKWDDEDINEQGWRRLTIKKNGRNKTLNQNS